MTFVWCVFNDLIRKGQCITITSEVQLFIYYYCPVLQEFFVLLCLCVGEKNKILLIVPNTSRVIGLIYESIDHVVIVVSTCPEGMGMYPEGDRTCKHKTCPLISLGCIHKACHLPTKTIEHDTLNLWSPFVELIGVGDVPQVLQHVFSNQGQFILVWTDYCRIVAIPFNWVLLAAMLNILP